jgi:hypothetical protein
MSTEFYFSIHLLQISSLLAKYAQHLLDEKKMLQAIELYRKANHFLEAARLLMELAKDETKKRSRFALLLVHSNTHHLEVSIG